ncbi:cation:dicarboxylate symporter family transporter [Nonomuraea aridisoli]|uniref:cation:dicarboxylate symporter family transporter n=1 Tax=Nonomuraea aridisoli TaxID=2070368 RepID=UPI0022A82B0B|nr:cation:dicarboxylase symporter family transporter [Nonomuraea aridisoli]
MLIAPIIFCTVVLGIAHVGDMRAAGRIGVKALVYFEVITTFALLFGLVVGNLATPGSDFAIDPATLATGAEAIGQRTGGGELPHTVEFLLGVIPASVISAFADNALLQVLFFAVLFGLALAKPGEASARVLELVDQVSRAFFAIMGWIMRLPPLGAFGAMSYIIGEYGLGSLGSFGKLIICCYAAAALFIVVLGVVTRVFAGVSLWRVVVYVKDELFLALGTASTEVVLPRIMAKLTHAGATLYLSICVLFLAQAVG